VPSTGKLIYTIGPGGDFNYGGGGFSQGYSTGFQQGGVVNPAPPPNTYNIYRPDKIEAAFLRQTNGDPGNPVDYPMRLLHSMEDYSRLRLKQLVAFPGIVYYDPAWPLGNLFFYPVPQANIYALGIVVKEQLPAVFPTLNTQVNLPPEYFDAIVTNLAMALRPKYGIASFPGDTLPGRAKEGLKIIRGSSVQITALVVDPALVRGGIYNIFSDSSY
jgi:hypothetical protein